MARSTLLLVCSLAIFGQVFAASRQAISINPSIELNGEASQELGAMKSELEELREEVKELREELHNEHDNVRSNKLGAGLHDKYPSINKTVTYLMNQMSYGMPRSYQDILPTGETFWTTSMYLTKGAFYPGLNGSKPTPVALDDVVAIQERTLTRYGLNLYDGATWQIALTLAGRKDMSDIYEREILYTSSTGSNPNSIPVSGIDQIRAIKDQYKYGSNKIQGKDLDKVTLPGNATNVPQKDSGFAGDKAVQELPGGLFFRMINPKYKMEDPFTGYFGTQWKYPHPNNDSTTKWNIFGLIHHNDWKPIMGENVWAAFIGPLQAMWIQNCTKLGGYNVTHNKTDMPDGNCLRHFETFEDAPSQIQLGMSIFPALNEMQSPLGSMYHCPKGSSLFPPDDSKDGEETNVSNENNVSAMAAFKMFWQIMFNRTVGTTDTKLVKAKSDITKLIQGLDKWFTKYLIRSATTPKGTTSVASQGGHVTFTGTYNEAPFTQPSGFAVDCQTWGMLVLGQKYIDDAYGAGMAYNVWQKTKELSGYFDPNGDLGGVGYTNLCNGTNADENCKHEIWSAEWTFGAIFMAERLSYEYGKAGEAQYSADLKKDADSMRKLLRQPMKRGKDSEWIGGGLEQEDGSYLYANDRFFIPWGWYANPIGATCSTSWSVMDNFNFNPFTLGGGWESPIPDPTPVQLKEHAEIHKQVFGEEPPFEY